MALSNTDLVTELYIGYFNRAPDPAGLQYWVNGLNNGVTFAQIADQFAKSSESTAIYPYLTLPSIVTPDSFINQVYQNVLGRSADADPSGLAFWKNALQTGAVTPGNFIATIIETVNKQVGTADALLLQNKVTAAEYYVSATASSNTPYTQDSAKAALAGVTGDASTVVASQATTDSYIANNGGAVITALTTGPDNLVGTAGKDVFSGYVDDTAGAGQTLTAVDKVSGGTGNDIFNITIGGTATSVLNGADVSGIETINVRNVGTGAAALDAANAPGVTTVASDRSTGTLTVTNLAAGSKVGLIGNGTVTEGVLTFDYATATSAVALNLSGGVKQAAAANAITTTAGTATTATINSTGAANTTGGITLSSGATVTALTINAASNLTITDGAGTAEIVGFAASNASLTVAGAASSVNVGLLENGVKTVDASGLTSGGLTVALGTGVASFKGGLGNDVVTTNAVAATAASSIDAGTGTADVLVVRATTDVDTAAEAKVYSGFDILKVDTGVTADLSLFTNSTITSEQISGVVTLNNVSAAQAGAITVTGSATPTINVTGATNAGQIDTVSLKVDDGAAAVSTITLANVNVAGVEKVAINAVDNVTVSSLTGATALTNLDLSGGGNISVTTGALALNVNTAVDAHLATGTFTFSAAAGTANGLSVTGSAAGVNTITGSAQADVIVGGAANDTLTGGNGSDLLTGGGGKDTFVFAAGSSGGAPSATVFDTIKDYSADVIDYGATALTIVSGSAAASGTAAINAQGIATFNAADNTLALKIVAAEAGINASGVAGAGQYAVFEDSGNTYLFVSDGTDNVGANDVLVKLQGVTGITTSTLTSGDLVLT